MRIVKGLSKVAAAALAVVMLIIGIGIGFAASPYLARQVQPTPTATELTTKAVTTTVTSYVTSTTTVIRTAEVVSGGLSGEIPIGALLPLSGPLGAFGQNDKIAVETAVREVNEFLEKIGANWRLRLYVEDTETNPSVALEKLTSLYAKGVKVVVGPMASSEVRNVKEYVDANKILVISQSSTAPELSIPGDHIYRFVPNDLYQGRIGPSFAKKIGATHMIFVWRGDSWGDGLADVAKKTARELGLTIAGEIRYAPEATEFSAEVAKLADIVNGLIAQGVPPEKIMVQIISFGEARAFLLTATEYDVLWKVKWFGSDGTAYESRLAEEPKVAEFSSKVRFVSPIFAPTKTPKYQELLNKIKAETGHAPEPYAYSAYDAVWVVALTLLATERYDADSIISAMPTVLEHYYGASGYIMLDEAGDRIGADYELVEIVRTDGGYTWEVTGVYHGATGEIVWQ